MAFRIFRLLVGIILGALSLWLIVDGVMPFVRPSAAGSASTLLTPVLQIVGGLVILAIYYYSLWTASPIKRVLENIFSIPELLKKLAFTLVLLCIYRVGFHVPLPGMDQVKMADMMKGQSEEGGTFADAINYFGMFTGGSLQQSTLFGLGIMPYISASIILQLMTTVVPALEKLKKEGPAGYKKIQEYTRYLTVPLCLVEAVFFLNVMKQFMYEEYSTFGMYAMCVLGLTGGTMFLMWLGEQIDEYGIGNGISLLIMAGIVSRLPWAISEVVKNFQPHLMGEGTGQFGLIEVLFLVAMFVFVVAGTILITQGQRRIPIQQAKQIRGRRVMGGQRNFLPLRVNHGGVMPLIFASSLMIFPNVIFGWLKGQFSQSAWIGALHSAFARDGYVYILTYVAMIFFFAYFWTTVQFRPKEMSDQLRDYGTFIPGLRPGRRTAEYLERVMERITYCGAAFLSIIAVLPTLVSDWMHINYRVSSFLGGTGLLICVSVALDLVQRIEANLVMRNYGGFLGGSTRIKGAYR